jgi:hypothetical protein
MMEVEMMNLEEIWAGQILPDIHPNYSQPHREMNSPEFRSDLKGRTPWRVMINSLTNFMVIFIRAMQLHT